MKGGAYIHYLFVAIVVLVSNEKVLSQTNRLSGIINSVNGPLTTATINVNGKPNIISADSIGKFSIRNILYGKLRLHVTAAGYQPFDSAFLFDSTTILSINMLPDNIIMDEVVISGTMRPVSKMSSPIPVEVYTAAFFKKNPTPNIFEGLQNVNGVQPQLNCNVCNTGDIHINGMEGPYTMILIDGMPIVSSLSTVYGLSGIPNSMVKRIEIVKGPASTLYGSEAVGGLINIITKDALSADKLTIDFSGTSVGEINLDVSAGYHINKISSLFGINYFNYQQKRDINKDNFTDVALQNRISIFNKWSTSLSASVNTSLALRYIYENRWGGQLQWQEKFRGSDSIYGESVVTKRVEVLNTTSFGKLSALDISYNYHRQQSFYGVIKYFATQQVAFVQWRWNKKIQSHELLAGIPLRYTFYDDNTPGTANIYNQNKPGHSFLPGIFIQDEWLLNKKVTILGGLRYDYNSDHGSIFTPRLSCKYKPDKTNTIRLSGGNGYRVVNLFTEDHAALTGARKVIIASALKPEQSWNGNINYTAFVRHKKGFINFDVSAFYTYFTNKIVGDYFTDATSIIYDNLDGYAVSKGITVNTDFNFTNGIKIMSGVTLMDVYQIDKTSDGEKLKTPQLFAPKISGTFTISYTLAKQNIAIDLTGKLNGPMYLPVVPGDFRSEQSPWYCIMNLQFTKSFATGLELYAGAKNLLGFIPDHPLLHPDDPFNKAGGKYYDAAGNPRADTNPNAYTFDPSYNYGSIQGIKIFAGLRWQIK
jgi:outer membrane receptor for ferrienterochelin and colicins